MFKEELIIIRHARSKYNTRETDNLDDYITPWGHRQAKGVGEFMAKHMNLNIGYGPNDFRCFTSPFVRCLQTAKYIAKSLDCHFAIDKAWREYLNHSRRDVHVERRDNWGSEFQWGYYPREGVLFKDEFNEEFIERITGGFDRLPQKSIVVTHGLPALLLLKVATGVRDSIPIWDYSIDNCSITHIVKGRVVWHGRNIFHECDFDPFDKPNNRELAIKEATC